MKQAFNHAIWAAVALVGAACLGVLALRRGETVSALWIVVAAVSTHVARAGRSGTVLSGPLRDGASPQAVAEQVTTAYGPSDLFSATT